MIEPELTLLQMQIESRWAHPFELNEPRHSQAPEAFNAVDVSRAPHELISVMTDTVMLLVAHVNYPVVGAKAIRMNGCREFHFAANNSLNAGLWRRWWMIILMYLNVCQPD